MNECPLCQGHGSIDATPCCGSPFIDTAEGYECFRCRKFYESRQCESCHGEGVSDP